MRGNLDKVFSSEVYYAVWNHVPENLSFLFFISMIADVYHILLAIWIWTVITHNNETRMHVLYTLADKPKVEWR